MDLFTQAHDSIQQKIKEHLASPVPLLQKLVDYAFDKPGKNIRSRLMVALCHDHGFDLFNPHFQNIAATIELIHAATLFHDDVIDNSPERRNQAAVPVAFSNTCSILLGDYCFSKSYMLLKDLPRQHLFFEKISQTAQDLIAGEVWQYQLRHQPLELTQYLDIIELKTARLFELATSGLHFLDSEIFSQELSTLGRDFGLLFQLMDDYFDYFRVESADYSKPAGKDFEEKKMTLPVILAIQHGVLTDLQYFWEPAQDFNTFVAHIEPIRPYCETLIQQHYQKLLQKMRGLPLTQVIMQQARAAFMPHLESQALASA